MKFSIPATTFFFATSAFSFNISKVYAIESPYVTCCESQGGTYGIMNTSNGSQSGFCSYNNENYDEMTFYETYCYVQPTSSPTPSPTPAPTEAPTIQDYKYSVYAVNDNCGMSSSSSGDDSTTTVSVEFVLQTFVDVDVERIVDVDINNNQCVYVGGTNEDTIDYSVSNSFVSSGHVSCKDIGNSNNDDCNLLGIKDNACVINIC